MAGWFADGRVLLLIMAGMAVEGVALVAWHARTGRGVAPGALLPNLLAGMALLGAMWLELAGAWWGWVSASLLAGGVLHGLDLRRRWM